MSKRNHPKIQAPEYLETQFFSESVAQNVCIYLAEKLDIEATMQHSTLFGPGGIEQHFFRVRAVCTEMQFREAVYLGTIETIVADSQLIEAGLLPEWNSPRGKGWVSMEDYC